MQERFDQGLMRLLSPELSLRTSSGSPANKRLCVAVSGGADSLALTFLTHQWCQTQGWRLFCITVDHKLRKESGHEARQVKQWLQNQGIAHQILPWDDPGAKGSHHKARQARYRLLIDWCRHNAVDFLLTAHQGTDQAETVLMRLFHGSGSDGLAGIHAVLKTPEITLLRPLLDFSPQDLEQYLRNLGQPWIQDPSNHNPVYERCRLRSLLPLLSSHGFHHERLNHVAEKMGSLKNYWDQELYHWFQSNVICHAQGFYEMDFKALCAVHPEFQGRILTRGIKGVGGHAYAPGWTSLRKVLGFLHPQAQAFPTQTLGGCLLSLYGDHFFITREERALGESIPVLPRQWVLWDGRFRVRCDQEGYRVASLGAEGWIKIKKQGILETPLPTHPLICGFSALSRVPARFARTWPAFFQGDQVVMLPFSDFNSHNLCVEVRWEEHALFPGMPKEFPEENPAEVKAPR